MIESKLIGSLGTKTLREFNELALTSRTILIEHRLDYLKENLPENFNYCYKGKQIIATVRPRELGGKFEGSTDDQINLLWKAVDSGATYIDVEMEMKTRERNVFIHDLKEKKINIIISSHNFQMTPEFDTLITIANEIKSLQGTIAKIVCFNRTYEESLRMLQLQTQAEIPMISFGMGPLGKYTRILSVLMGAPYAYVAISAQTAPGQLTVEEFISIFEKLSM